MRLFVRNHRFHSNHEHHMVTLALQRVSPQGASLHPVLRPCDALAPGRVPGGAWVPEGLQQPVLVTGGTESCQKHALGGGVGGSVEGEQWDVEVSGSRCQAFRPGCAGLGILPRLGFGQGLVKGNLFLQGGARSSWVPGQGLSFASHPNAGESLPSASDSSSPSILSAVSAKPAQVCFNPYFRRFLGCPHS